jgi:dihydrodipicolinate reductase
MNKVRARTLFANKRFTVSAVELLELRTDKTSRVRFMTGSLKPIAVIVNEADRAFAFDMEGQPVDIDRLNLPADTRVAQRAPEGGT